MSAQRSWEGFGAELARYRGLRGYTQREAAELAAEQGDGKFPSYTLWGQHEKGYFTPTKGKKEPMRQPSDRFVLAVCKILPWSLEEAFTAAGYDLRDPKVSKHLPDPDRAEPDADGWREWHELISRLTPEQEPAFKAMLIATVGERHVSKDSRLTVTEQPDIPAPRVKKPRRSKS